MSELPTSVPIEEQLDALYRTDSRRILATLIRLLGDFDLAEDALHDAFRATVEQWPREGVPANPRAWLVQPGVSKLSTPCAAAPVLIGCWPISLSNWNAPRLIL